MSVWISDEKLLIFASLISPSKMILFEQKHQSSSKNLEVRQKYSAVRRIFNSLLGVSSGDETLHLMFDILHENGTRHHFRDNIRGIAGGFKPQKPADDPVNGTEESTNFATYPLVIY